VQEEMEAELQFKLQFPTLSSYSYKEENYILYNYIAGLADTC